MQRMQARKDSVSHELLAGTLEEGQARAVFSGLDLDVDEIFELQPQIVTAFALALAAGHISNVGLAAAGLFWDGIATGLLMAEARQREEARN